jgi:hypothetical protein
MTEQEKAAIYMQTVALRKEGKTEEADALRKTIPLPPFMAKFAKENYGVDYLKNSKWNLSEAEAAFGADWLSRYNNP